MAADWFENPGTSYPSSYNDWICDDGLGRNHCGSEPITPAPSLYPTKRPTNRPTQSRPPTARPTQTKSPTPGPVPLPPARELTPSPTQRARTPEPSLRPTPPPTARPTGIVINVFI